ncbi:hypothetical protein ACM41_11965 [Bradyrhizobium sp. CCBAU 21362]|nr:hypothetical protein [Bradyrhizobium sp. CCBAU 21362]
MWTAFGLQPHRSQTFKLSSDPLFVDKVRDIVWLYPNRAIVLSVDETIKARWICEQAHQQLKEELGLDHFEGRSWQGLHRHALMTMIAYAFLQHHRLAYAGRKKESTGLRLNVSPSSISSFGRRLSSAHIAESKSLKAQTHSAKVVLASHLERKFVTLLIARISTEKSARGECRSEAVKDRM